MLKNIIGVISDTHGLFRPEIVPAFKDCGLILHAGDIGNPEVLHQLENIAPVIAIRGNNDKGIWAENLPLTREVKFGNILIYLLHNLHELDIDPSAAGINAVISGHSHKAIEKWQNGILFLNPGSAGPKRFSLPICVAILEITENTINVRHINLGIIK